VYLVHISNDLSLKKEENEDLTDDLNIQNTEDENDTNIIIVDKKFVIMI
jgi:hypothetical protein